MIYGYARCSTSDKKQDVERQTRDLSAMGAELVLSEYANGADACRRQFNALKKMMAAGDTLMATELSRVTRSVRHLCDILDWAIALRVKIKVGGLEADCTGGELDPMVECMFLMLGVFAQMERKIIVQRVKSGVACARDKGVKLGRPKKTGKKDLPDVFKANYKKYIKGGLSKTEFARLCGVSRPTLYRYLSIMEIKGS